MILLMGVSFLSFACHFLVVVRSMPARVAIVTVRHPGNGKIQMNLKDLNTPLPPFRRMPRNTPSVAVNDKLVVYSNGIEEFDGPIVLWIANISTGVTCQLRTPIILVRFSISQCHSRI
jgi:hypothetical protein